MSQRRPFTVVALSFLLAALVSLAIPSPANAGYTTLVNRWSWTYWNNAYPWGPTHNGSAYMLQAQVGMNNTALTLHAQPDSTHPGYRFKSGTIYCKTQVLCNSTYINWTVDGQFRCSTAPGCWPAMWLTGANSWPPEIDIMEFKGNTTVWQNTYDGTWRTKTKVMSDPLGTWHRYKVWINRIDNTNLDIHYYIDGVWQKADRANFVGKPMWLIIDFQTEGSSGTATWTDKWMYGGTIEVGRSTP